MINFGKRREEAQVLKRLMRFQSKVYSLDPVPQIQALFLVPYVHYFSPWTYTLIPN